MTEVRKRVCIDNVKSHYSGILPYFGFGSGATDAMLFVNNDDSNGNWGGFACDFAKVCSCLCGDTTTYVKTTICTSGITSSDNSIEARLRYCDLSMKYNFIQKLLRDGVYCKIVDKEVSTVLRTDCQPNKYGCSADTQFRLTTQVKQLAVVKYEPKIKYDYIPLPINMFNQIGNYLYAIHDYDYLRQTYTDEEIAYVIDLLNTTQNQYIVLINNYDVFSQYELDWIVWWTTWFGQDWSDNFPNHITYDNYQFCLDFERYCLGKVCVPEVFVDSGGTSHEINGIFVPSYITYNEVGRRLEWFENNDVADKSEDELKVWNDNGGDNFYAYLQTLDTFWVTGNTAYSGSGDVQCRLAYIKPYISIPISLNDSYAYETIYETYDECSKPFSAVGIYSGYSQFMDNDFVYLTDSGRVESQLYNLQSDLVCEICGITGVWKRFTPKSNYSDIFQCTFYSATSLVAGETAYETKYYINGRSSSKAVSAITEEVLPNTQGNPERIILETNGQHVVVVSGTPIASTEFEQYHDGLSATVMTTAYTSHDYSWWECSRITSAASVNIVCGDGEIIGPNTQKYRSIPLLNVLPKVIEHPNVGDVYYFMAEYDNGRVNDTNVNCCISGTSIATFGIPYKNSTYNILTNVSDDVDNNSYIANYIGYSGITISSGKCDINYVIGGVIEEDPTSRSYSIVDNKGIHYHESYNIRQSAVTLINIDGYVDVEMFYDELDVESNKELVYSDEYRMNRYAVLADLIGMQVATVWNSAYTVIAPIFTKESTSQFLNNPIDRANVVFDRGATGAFEKYFKLSECDTFNDLKKYGNNYFNLE